MNYTKAADFIERTMNMDELMNIENMVRCTPAKVIFPQYKEVKADAQMMADRIRQAEVTEDNVKDIKKDLAKVRKIVIELNNRRKAVKAEIFTDYNVFESQIKEIDAIISEAESFIRDQVKTIEEAERKRKCEAIREIWDKRIGQYTISNYGDYFERWMLPSYLNKTTSMKLIEEEMVTWLEATQMDLAVLATMDKEYTVEYLTCLDMATAIQTVNHNKEIRSMIGQDEDEIEATAVFVITGEKDIRLAEAILKENKIDYRRTK